MTCIACGDSYTEERTVRFACAHSFCEECVGSLVESCARRASPLSCTCSQERRELVGQVPATVVDRYSGWISAPPGKGSERGWEEALNLRCPHCDSVFVDFDACASLQCSCGGHFCAFCLRPSASARESHEHVLVCPHNPSPGSYFVTASSYESVRTFLQSRAAASHALSYPNALMRAGSSLAFARMGVPCPIGFLDAVRLPLEMCVYLLSLFAFVVFSFVKNADPPANDAN